MKSFKQLAVVLAFLSVAATAPAMAATVYSDNFNANATGLNQGPSGWQVSNGTIDVIGLGSGWEWSFGASNGVFLDLDGSTWQAGVLTQTLSNLNAGSTYTLSFDLAGSQRGDTNTVDVSFGAASGSFTVAGSDVFSTHSVVFKPTANGTYSFSFHNQGGDNVGALLDNVRVTEDAVAAVPEPETYALMLAGLAGVGFMARRRSRR